MVDDSLRTDRCVSRECSQTSIILQYFEVGKEPSTTHFCSALRVARRVRERLQATSEGSAQVRCASYITHAMLA
jgi:hypothetical protein